MSAYDNQSLANLTIKQIKNGQIQYNEFGDYNGFFVDDRLIKQIEIIAMVQSIEESVIDTTIKLYDLTTKDGDYLNAKIFNDDTTSSLRFVYIIVRIYYIIIYII